MTLNKGLPFKQIQSPSLINLFPTPEIQNPQKSRAVRFIFLKAAIVIILSLYSITNTKEPLPPPSAARTSGENIPKKVSIPSL